MAQSLPKETVNVMENCKNPEMKGKLTVSLNEMVGLNTVGIKAIDYKQTELIKMVEKQQLAIEKLINENEALQTRIKELESKK